MLSTKKKDIINSHEKGKKYQKTVFWYRLYKAKETSRNLQNYISRNGIFLQPELKEIFSTIIKILYFAIISKEAGHEAKDFKMQNEGWKKIEEETEPLYKEIEEYIHGRLQSHGRNP